MAALIGVVPIAARGLRAQQVDEAKARKVVAAYLYNFAKFIEFPDGTFGPNGEPFVIGIAGDSELAGVLERTVSGKTIKGRSIEVMHFRPDESRSPHATSDVHVLYLSDSAEDFLADVLDDTAGRPVLVVSSIPAFAQRGGMIGLLLHEGRIVFEINRSALARAALVPSSRLLGLAKSVSSDEEDHRERSPLVERRHRSPRKEQN